MKHNTMSILEKIGSYGETPLNESEADCLNLTDWLFSPEPIQTCFMARE